ncbi:uncharacterized protein METZ01_LOCUS183710, partial [marine metagenome]
VGGLDLVAGKALVEQRLQFTVEGLCRRRLEVDDGSAAADPTTP